MYACYTGIGVGHYAQYNPPTSLNHNIDILGIHCEPPAAVDEHVDDKHGPSTDNDGVNSAEEDSNEEPDVGDYNDDEEDPEDSELEEDAMDEDFGSEEDEYDDDNDSDPSLQVKF